jgi:hypothetical protein
VAAPCLSVELGSRRLVCELTAASAAITILPTPHPADPAVPVHVQAAGTLSPFPTEDLPESPRPEPGRVIVEGAITTTNNVPTGSWRRFAYHQIAIERGTTHRPVQRKIYTPGRTHT